MAHLLHPTLAETRFASLDDAAGFVLKNASELRGNTDAIVALINQVLEHERSLVRLAPSRIGGYGLFAHVDLSADLESLCTYGGIRMSHNVYIANEIRHGSEYVIETGRGDEVIDGSICFELRQVGRWCNGEPDSSGGWIHKHGGPNCRFASPDGGATVVLTPVRDITAGTELLVDYGEHYQWQAYGYERQQVKRRGGMPTKRSKTGNIDAPAACLQCGITESYAAKLWRCTGCGEAVYCGEACAQRHWDSTHFRQCGY